MRKPEKYNWDPKWLLSHLIDIYLHLDSEALVSAIANDQVRGREIHPQDYTFLITAIFQTGDLPRHRREDGEHARPDQHGRREVRR